MRTLRPASWIHFDNTDHLVVGLDGACVRLRSVDGDEQRILVSYLLSHESFGLLAGGPGTGAESSAIPVDEGRIVADGNASAVGLPATGDDGRATDEYRDRAAILDTLGEQVKQQLLTVEEAIVEIVERTEAAPGESTVGALIKAKAAELGMSERSLWTKYTAWRTQGLWGLVDGRRTKAHDPLAGVDVRIVAAILDQASAEEHASTGKRHRFREMVRRRLETAYGDDAPQLPPVSTFSRWCDHLLGGRHTFGNATTRRTAANSPRRVYRPGRATRAGEVVMIDATPIDVLCYDPVTDTTVSVELTIAVDLATRTIAAWRLTPKGTGGADIALLLADMLTPVWMRSGWRESVRFKHQSVMFTRLTSIEQRLEAVAARPLIYPELIIVDNGSIMKSSPVVAACKRLGITLQPARLDQPTDKPQVERAFGTIGTMFSEYVAGYKGANVVSRGRDVDAEARFTVDELEEFFAEWVVAVYQRRTHAGLTMAAMPELRMSPNDAYAHAIALTGWIPIPGPNIYYELLPLELRYIDRKGVAIGGLTYVGDAIKDKANRRSTYPNMGGKWPFRVDPRNRLHVYFRDPDTGTWEALRWKAARADTEPFAQRTYEYVRQQLVERGTSNPHEEDVEAALADLRKRTGAPEMWTATDRRVITKDRARTRAALQDRARAEAEGDETAYLPDDLPPARPKLRVVSDDDEDYLDLDEITAFDTFDSSHG